MQSVETVRPQEAGIVEAVTSQVQIVETDEVLEVIWNIPLGTGSVKIRKTDRYLKNSEVCELQRRDGRHGALRSQLNFTPEGHIHIRWGAAVH